MKRLILALLVMLLSSQIFSQTTCPPPSVSITMPNSGCLNSDISIKATEYLDHTYQWDVGDGTIISSNKNTIIVRWSTPGLKPVSVVVTSPCGQRSDPMQPTIINIVSSIQPLEIDGAITVCPNAPYSYKLSKSDPNISALNWEIIPSSGGTIANQSPPPGLTYNPVVNVTWNTPGTYTLKIVASNQCGLTQSKNITITVNNGVFPGNPTIVGTNNTCISNKDTYSVSPLQTGTSYLWASSYANLIPNGSAVSVNWTTSNTGFETIKVTPYNSACSGNTIAKYVRVYEQTSGGNATALVSEICHNSVADISLVNYTGSVLYWELRRGSSSTTMSSWEKINITQPFHSPTLTNNTSQNYFYDFRATLKSGVCLEVKSTEVRITVLPVEQFTIGPNPILCSGQISNVELKSSIPNTTFNWSVETFTSGVSGFSSGNGNTIKQTLTNSSLTTGTVTYRVTLPPNKCNPYESVITIPVSVKPQILITNSTSQLQTTICSNTPINFTPTANFPESTFSWTSTVSGSISGASGTGTGTITDKLINNDKINGSVIYLITPSNGGCSGSPRDYLVTVKPLPEVSGSNISICSGQTTNLTLVPKISGSTLSWPIPSMVNASGGTSGSGVLINQTLFSNPSTSSGSVSYKITPVANSCTGVPLDIIVTVNPNPNIVNTPTELKSTICSGSVVNFLPLSNLTGTQYAWISSIQGSLTGASPSGTGSISNVLTNNSTTVATATYIITPSAKGCNGSPSTFIVDVVPQIIPKITGNLSFCSSTTLTASPSGNSYLWSNGKTTQSITVSSTGTYSVTVSNGICPSTAVSASVTKKPASAYITAEGDICTGLKLTSSYGTSYRWSTGSTSNFITTFSYGTYSVTVTLTNGCIATAYYSVPSSTDVLSVNSSGREAPPPCDEMNALSLESEFNSVSVSPNPVSSIVLIEISNSVSFDVPIAFINQFGQQVYCTVLESGERTKYIDTDTLPNGLYFISIGPITNKVIINH